MKVRWLFLHSKSCYLLKKSPAKVVKNIVWSHKKKKKKRLQQDYILEWGKINILLSLYSSLVSYNALFTLSRFITFAFCSIPTILTISISSLCKGFSSHHESFYHGFSILPGFFVFFLAGINWKMYCSRQIFGGCSSQVLECLRMFVY